MLETSRSKVKVTDIEQVSFVVKDIWGTVKNFWKILGIGPWDIYPLEPPLVHEYEYHGRPAQGRAKIALAQVGNLQLELVQHIDGDTIFRDFLLKHGEGLHSLTSRFQDNKVVEALMAEGFRCLQRMWHGDKAVTTYINIEPLHTIWKFTSSPSVLGAKVGHYPDTKEPEPAIQVATIRQVSIVVRDLWDTVKNFWKILDIGPWEIYPLEPPLVHEYEYHGRPAQSRAKIAFTQVGRLQLELVQHIDGDTIFRDFLLQHGEGLNHFNFPVADVDEVVRVLVEQGFPCLQRAGYGDNGAIAFIDIKPLHSVWELLLVPHDRLIKPTRYPGYAEKS